MEIEKGNIHNDVLKKINDVLKEKKDFSLLIIASLLT